MPSICKTKKTDNTTTIEVNKKALISYIVRNCPYHNYNCFEGDICYRKINKEICNISIFSKDLHCPSDCPRLGSHPSDYACDKGRCPGVRAKLKKLKETPSEY